MFSLCLFGPVISLSLHFLRSKMKLTRCQLQGLDMRFQEDKYRAGKFPFFHGLAQRRFYKGSSWRPWISVSPTSACLSTARIIWAQLTWPRGCVHKHHTACTAEAGERRRCRRGDSAGALADLLAGNSQSLELKCKAARGRTRQLNPEGAWVWRKMEEDRWAEGERSSTWVLKHLTVHRKSVFNFDITTSSLEENCFYLHSAVRRIEISQTYASLLPYQVPQRSETEKGGRATYVLRK